MSKRALVTGSRGFVGRHMVNELRERGWYTHGIDIGNWPDFRPQPLGYTSKGYDERRDAAAYFRYPPRDEEYDLLVHCAYQVGGRAAIDGKNLNLADNLILDAEMFKYAAQGGIGHVLYFSSSAVYPVGYQDGHHDPKVRLREDMAKTDNQWIGQPDAAYGWAKMNGERLADMARANGVGVSVVRPFSGYGAGQSDDYPFPSIVRRALAGDLSVWGPPGQTRDWIHISDVVKGALAVAECQGLGHAGACSIPDERKHDPVNLCTGRGVEMGGLALRVWRELNDCGEYPRVTYHQNKPTGVLRRVGEPTRMETYYAPMVSLEAGIREAIEHARMDGS
jgi:nucleoside-diphosphate-sugar epimerase